MRIVILGAPGAGKGTQCKRVVEKYDLHHLSSGDILRKNRAEGTELGKKAQSYMDSGKLVPDDLIVEMMAEAISKTPDAGFVLDGFPRTVNQAEELDKALAADGKKIDAVVDLEIDDDIILGRMTGRRSCPQQTKRRLKRQAHQRVRVRLQCSWFSSSCPFDKFGVASMH